MSLKSKLLMVLASLLLVTLYFTPIWTITLTAPQYPTGLGMYISVDDITGHEQHDLQNINILNHYVGMKPIVPEEIPELDFMPWMIAGLIFMGLMVAVIGKPSLIIAWLVLFLICGVAGLVDFYMWGYDYGHNLNPKAAIKIPGESYQPPLFGTKQMLNIKASSYPYCGSLFMGISLLLGCIASWLEFKPHKSMDDNV
ncbi:MAG: hypothetical protein WD267_10855 [Balneolales bacterium]